MRLRLSVIIWIILVIDRVQSSDNYISLHQMLMQRNSHGFLLSNRAPIDADRCRALCGRSLPNLPARLLEGGTHHDNQNVTVCSGQLVVPLRSSAPTVAGNDAY